MSRLFASFRRSSSLILGLLLHFSLVLLGCGGGGSNGAGGGQPISPGQSFSFQLNAQSISLIPGNSAAISLGIEPANFDSQVSVKISNLPAGVSASPTDFTLSSTAIQVITFSAATTASVTSVTATITGTAGSFESTINLLVTVVAPLPPTLSTRTRYVRTDAVVEYWQWVNSHWEVLHSPTSRVFVTDPESNRIFVFDLTSETEIGNIYVPGAFSIDETADESTLYIGTLIGDVYTVDPVAMAVTNRYLASEIGSYGYPAIAALPLADGRLALLGVAGGTQAVDGSSSIAIWNPADNSISIYGSGGFPTGPPSPPPTSPLCGGSVGSRIFGFSLTRDRKSILVSGEEQGSGVCEMNSTTGSYITATPSGSPLHLATSPDGRYLAFPTSSGGAAIYSVATLSLVNQFSVAGDTSSASDFVFSADSTTLFVPSMGTVYAYNVASGQQIGWMSNLFVVNSGSGLTVGPATGPNYELVDPTGLLIGPLEEGLGFVDTTTMRTGPVGTIFATSGAEDLSPATGPSSGGTLVQEPKQNQYAGMNTMYFGPQAATRLSNDSGTISATTPAGTPGPVPVYTFAADGGMQLIADGFSYGPSVLEVSPNLATADGGGTGVTYGYGFGPVASFGIDANTIPGGLAVAVAGVPTKVVGAFVNSLDFDPPFLSQSVSYTIPPGSSGSTVSVEITSSSGTTVSNGSLTYLPATQQFSLPGSALAQGIYDPTSDMYYFTDATSIQIFSLTQKLWLPPISIAGAQRLWGIALSPDGTKLAVADIQAGLVYLINPANTSSIQSFTVPPLQGQTIAPNPVGIAITDDGVAYFVTTSPVFKLDTSTGAFTNYNVTAGGNSASPPNNFRAELSADGSRVYFDDTGDVYYIDTTTGSIMLPANTIACCAANSDFALSPQGPMAFSSYLFDAELNPESFLTLNDREIQNTAYVYGEKLSPDGRLLFQPSTNGIDVYDGRLGILLDRIALPFALSTNYDALVADGKDNVLIAITGATGNGIAVVDLTSIQEPPPLTYAELHRALSAQHRIRVPASVGGSRRIAPRAVPYVVRSMLLQKHSGNR